MKFGLSFLPDAKIEDKTPASYFFEAIELSCSAENYGLHTIKMTEHYLHPYGGYCPSPLTFLSAVASRTKNIRLMTGCILPAFHHPIQIAAETSLLDAISNGRLDVGFARGYLPYEFMAFGVDLDESRDRYVSTIDAVLQLWTQPSVSINTPFFKFENVRNYPPITQKSHPPVWGAAVNSRQSFAWLGEQGFSLLVTPPAGHLNELCPLLEIYRSAFTKNHPGKTPDIAISLPLLIHPSRDQAIIDSTVYLNRYMNIWANAASAWDYARSSNYARYTGMAAVLKSCTPDLMRERLQALVGNPQDITEKIFKIRDLLNINHILWQIDFGAQPFDVSNRTLKLFAEVVMPKIRNTCLV